MDLLDSIRQLYDLADFPVLIINQKLQIVWENKWFKESFPNFMREYDGNFLFASVEKEFLISQLKKNKTITFSTPDTFLMGYVEITASPLPVPESSDPLFLLQLYLTPENERNQPHPGLTTITATIAKEFRLSVSIIFSSLEIIRNRLPKESDENIFKYLDVISKSGYKLLKLVTNLYEFSNLLSDKRINKQQIDIVSFITELTDAASVMIRSNRQEFIRELPEHSIFTCIDSNLFSIAILNILENCCIYQKEHNTIHFKMQQNKRNIIITISDTGLGIPTSIISKVFDPYFSYDPDGLPDARAGLGLTLTKIIIEKHGGGIAIQSKELEGTTIAITLPIVHDINWPTMISQTCASYLKDHYSTVYIQLSSILPTTLF